jgi:hypothetical protein
MRRCLAAVALLLWIAAAAQAKDLSWRSFDVKARLDAQGALHVVETQTFVFDGDWNGGERTFRLFPGQGLAFETITRVDPDGFAPPADGGDLQGGRVRLRRGCASLAKRRLPIRRSRTPSSPYEIAYTLSGSS